MIHWPGWIPRPEWPVTGAHVLTGMVFLVLVFAAWILIHVYPGGE